MCRFTSLLTCALILALLISSGCSPNTGLDAQRQSQLRIAQLESDLQTAQDKTSRLGAKLTEQQALSWKLQEESKLQQAEFDKLMKEFDAMAERAGRSGPLPERLDAMLIALADANSELLSYDPVTGRVRLKSDVTFSLGSDQIKNEAKPTLVALAQICSSELAQNCQIIVVGHTDDVRIAQRQTKIKHPTNWHLSVNRAIAVMELLKKSMPEDRLAVMGFGEFKPIAENAPNNQGNPLNRRVEIFIVPKELDVPSTGLK